MLYNNKQHEVVAIYNIYPKPSVNSNLAEYRSSKTPISVAKSFWTRTTVILCCKISERFDNCKISYVQMRICDIWIYNEIEMDIQYCNSPFFPGNAWQVSWEKHTEYNEEQVISSRSVFLYIDWTGHSRESIEWSWTTRWRHQMETFSAFLAICAAN